VRLLADGYRHLTEGKLAGRSGSGPTRAEAGRAAATLLAEAAQGVECRDSAEEPPWRRVPHLHDFAVGDQIAVVGHDLCAALAGLGPEMLVWTRAGRQPADRTAARALEAVRRLRLTL
jgi:hypothetical protein